MSRPAAGVMPRALIFDTFGTVVDWRGSIIAEGNAWGKAKGINVDWARFADRWRSGYTPGGCSNCSMRSIPSQAARSCVRLPSCRISALPPSAWVLPLRFTGGGLSGANLWIGDRFSASSRRRDVNNPATNAPTNCRMASIAPDEVSLGRIRADRIFGNDGSDQVNTRGMSGRRRA